MKYNKILDIDDDDKKIIELLQENCDITHKEIADKIDKSQPAVGARILKLERKNLLVKQIGINFKETHVKFARIDISASNTEGVWDKFKKCPILLNAFKQTGKHNLCIEIIAPSVDTIEKFIDDCLREDNRIINVETTYLIDSLFNYPVKMKFSLEDYELKGCNQICQGSLSMDDVEVLLDEK